MREHCLICSMFQRQTSRIHFRKVPHSLQLPNRHQQCLSRIGQSRDTSLRKAAIGTQRHRPYTHTSTIYLHSLSHRQHTFGSMQHNPQSWHSSGVVRPYRSILIIIMESNRGVPCRPAPRQTPNLVSIKSAADLQADPNCSYINTLASKNFEKYEVIVESDQLEGELRCIEWRSKTEFPIVKVLFYKILQKKLLGECSVVQVAIENFPHNLHTLPQLSLPQGLYLLKEALIGFQRLFDRFGSFDPSARMVLIGKNGKCKVWINENITLNFPSRRNKLTQRQFVSRLLSLFEEKCVRSCLSFDFFGKMGLADRFVQALQILECFLKNNKIALPSKLNLVAERNSPKKNALKHEGSLDKMDEILNCGSLKKIPKFVLQMREEKKPESGIDSKSFDSPKKKELQRDRSTAKTAIIPKIQLNGKSQLESECKSNVSPLSQTSQDKKQTKSNNEKPIKLNQNALKPAVRELLKQNSQQIINTYATMIPIANNYYKTDKKLPQQGPAKQIDLTLTKLPEKSQKKIRKLSNEESPSKKKQHVYRMINKPNKATPPIKQQCSVLSSQQTAATIDDTTHRKLTKFIEKQPQMSILSKAFEGDHEETCIFQKNGWLKRMNTLTSDNLRETIQSEYEGQQTFSEDYLLVRETLGMLGNMGRQLKGSITAHDTKL